MTTDTDDMNHRERELTEAVGEFIRENIDLNYRQEVNQAWANLSDALESGENVERAYWQFLEKCDEMADLLAGDLDRAGHIDRSAPHYQVHGYTYEVAFGAARAVHSGDEKRLERVYDDFLRLGKALGQARVDVLGELEADAAQPYEGVAGTPSSACFEGRDTKTVLEPDDLESAVLVGMVADDGPHLTAITKGEDVEAAIGVDLTPRECREVARMLFKMAGDAEGSGAVQTNE